MGRPPTTPRHRTHRATAAAVLALLAAGWLGSRAGHADRPRPQTDTAIHDVSNSPDKAEGEESVAVNPTDPSNILVGSNLFQPLDSSLGAVPEGGSGSQQAGVWSSHDGGRTWTGVTINRGGFGPLSDLVPGVPSQVAREFADAGNVIASDQSVVFDRHGTAYYESILFGAGPATSGDVQVIVHRSSDGGTTWQPGVVAFSQNGSGIKIDRPFLAVDTSGGPHDGTLYLGWETQFYLPTPNHVYVRSSSDGGRTWGAIHQVDDAAHPAMWDAREYPVVGADGSLFIVYDSSATATPEPYDPGSRDIQIYLARSGDGGSTFHISLVEPHAFRIPEDPYEAIPAVEELITAIAVDPRDAAHIAVAWPDARSGEARVLLRTSTDGGAHWSAPRDVADDRRGTGNPHDHAALAFLPDGRVLAVWRDRRNGGDSFDGNFDVFARAFTLRDGAPQPSGPVARLTTAPQPPTTFPTGIQPSEYLAVAAGDAGVTATWDQMSGDLPDNVERRLPLDAFAPTATGG